jgi:hypothetical protein
MRTNAAAGAALASALTAAAGASDGPGGVVYPNWGPLQELTWQRNVRSLGTVAALASGDSSSAPIPVILADGSLRVHPPGRFAPFGLPVPGDLGAVRWAGVTTGEWFLAITESGALRQWSANGPGFAPADASWRFIALGRSNPVGVTGDGTMRAWSFAGPLAIEGAVAGPVSLGAGDRWGMSVDALGVARPFALGDAAVPGIPATAGARSVAVDPLAEAASVAAQVDPGSSAVILRNDGSLTTASGISLGAGPYSQVAWSGNAETRVVALRTDGRAEVVAASGVEVTVPGCYREVWGARGSLSAYGAVWNDDCDRDGEPDAAQIVRGELPDANGDLVDDRRQSPFVLPDLNANGIPDHAETGTDTKLCARTTLTYHLLFQGGGNPAPVREVWAAATRIREGGEVVDRVTWLAARPTVAAQYAFQPIPAVLHVWSDPDGDGLPHDAVEILAVPTTLRVGMNTIDFPPVRIGERGESVFVGLTWVRPAGLVYGAGMGCWQRTSPVAGDPVAASRLQGALRVGSSPDLSRSPTDILRGDFGSATQSPEVGGSGTLGIGFIPYVALGSVRALPTDCDRNGIVDAVELAAASTRASPTATATARRTSTPCSPARRTATATWCPTHAHGARAGPPTATATARQTRAKATTATATACPTHATSRPARPTPTAMARSTRASGTATATARPTTRRSPRARPTATATAGSTRARATTATATARPTRAKSSSAATATATAFLTTATSRAASRRGATLTRTA